MTMADVERLLAEFIAQDRGPTPADPSPFLEQVEGTDRKELLALIDAYLARAPRRPVAPSALRGGAGMPDAARAVADRLERTLLGVSGEWPALLPRLRDAARLTRRQLVHELAERLDVADDAERVAEYYHRMEHGLLPADGVSDRVLRALAGLLGTTAARLRDAGRAVAAAPIPLLADEPAFARTATPDDELAAPPPSRDGDATDVPPDMSRPRGRVDELFTGGPAA